MAEAQLDPNPAERTEPARPASRSHRKKRRRSRHRPRDDGQRRLRLIYFGLAAAWGYLVGTAAILGGLAAIGSPLRLEPETALLLAGAGLLAVLGGGVAAVAYRDASSRYRG